MAQLTIEIPNDKVEEIALAISTVRGYQEQIQDGEEMIDNPQTRVQFVKEQIIDDLKRDYKRYKVNQSRIEEAEIRTTADSFVGDLS